MTDTYFVSFIREANGDTLP